jgi:vitellogenic carboxypeptidase-like protein
VFDNLLNGDLTGHASAFSNLTGFSYYFNYLMTEEPEDMGYYPAYLEQPSTRLALHVGNLSYADSAQEVEKHLLADMMQSSKPWLQAS